MKLSHFEPKKGPISKGKACLPTGNFQELVFRESMLQLSEMRTKGTPQDWDAYFLAG